MLLRIRKVLPVSRECLQAKTYRLQNSKAAVLINLNHEAVREYEFSKSHNNREYLPL